MAAPMTAKAAKDTAIAGTRLEATCCATLGCLFTCVSLSRASATCVPYGSAQSHDSSPSPVSKKESRGRSSNDSRASRPPEFGLNHGLIWLMIGYSRDQPRRTGRMSAVFSESEHSPARREPDPALARKSLRAEFTVTHTTRNSRSRSRRQYLTPRTACCSAPWSLRSAPAPRRDRPSAVQRRQRRVTRLLLDLRRERAMRKGVDQ